MLPALLPQPLLDVGVLVGDVGNEHLWPAPRGQLLLITLPDQHLDHTRPCGRGGPGSGDTLESVDELAAVVIGDVRGAIQVISGETELGPAPLPAEQRNRGQRGHCASPADLGEPFGVHRADSPVEPAQRLAVLATLLQQLGSRTAATGSSDRRRAHSTGGLSASERGNG